MKGKKIAIVSHCILNQNSVVNGLERAEGAFNEVVEILLKNNYAIIQLPCPELLYLGINREGKTKEEYDTKEYRKLCRELLKPIIKYLQEYTKDDFKFILIGIENSPTCDIFKNRGILMEELLKEIEILDIDVEIIAYPKNEEDYEEFIKNLKKMIE
ncbi:CD3072 family TudS-related putative desulfidase [Methanocaldococcus sp. 16A]